MLCKHIINKILLIVMNRLIEYTYNGSGDCPYETQEVVTLNRTNLKCSFILTVK